MQQRPPSFGLNSGGFNLAPPRIRPAWQPEIVSNRLIRPKMPAKTVKTLHKITAKMARTLGLDQNNEK
jgi:hypothetical protein